MNIWDEIAAERARAHAKHGDKSMEAADWADMKRLRILLEEVGEVARVFNEWDLGHLSDSAARRAARDELVQVAAMAGAWADAATEDE
jgi:NTP pyrophosphatase (non-canonical NTP hydrolase)